MNIEKQIIGIKPDLHSLIEEFKGQVDVLIDKIQKLTEVLSNFDNNWVGSWASPNFDCYKDFTSGNRGTLRMNYDAMQVFIETEAGLKFKEISDEVTKISIVNREFQNNIVTELSVIKGIENLESEIEILNKIEIHKWGISPREYINLKRPQNVITYNPASLLNKGLEIPPHISIGAELMSLFTTLIAIQEFWKNSKRLLRQIELKFSLDEPTSPKSNFIIKIINSFHSVAIQIRNRYSKRATLTISDEYDVQDLFHALLRMEFDDIRPEEYTPSYAGSATRMDFLVKNEKTVIEVKKTRNGLSDKELGDQLILDTQHYKAHPDCKRLICFVYDPENRIKNPRGIESDLSKLTTDELVVEVYIRP
jgi:hypothetical protein